MLVCLIVESIGYSYWAQEFRFEHQVTGWLPTQTISASTCNYPSTTSCPYTRQFLLPDHGCIVPPLYFLSFTISLRPSDQNFPPLLLPSPPLRVFPFFPPLEPRWQKVAAEGDRRPHNFRALIHKLWRKEEMTRESGEGAENGRGSGGLGLGNK